MPGNENISVSTISGETKLCYIVKRPDFDGYGFNLHSEKIKPGQFIGKVDANSPALLAGLKEGDRIIEVNGTPIGNETHKQVVQRIKAISNEVRLLLIDVDGATPKSTPSQTVAYNANDAKATSRKISTTKNENENHSNNSEKYHGNVQEILGTSANISTISMISTKRLSITSSSGTHTPAATDVPVMSLEMPLPQDVSDRTHDKNGKETNSDVMSRSDETNMHQSINNETLKSNISCDSLSPTPPPSANSAAAPQITAETTTISGISNKAGILQLPMTAAEMRAKLLSKKKYDPKNESVDLKKKFEIIQTL